MKKSIVLLIALFILCSFCLAQTVDDIIQKNLEARGGLDKIKAIKTTKLNGKMILGDFEMRIMMWHQKPNMMKMVSLIGDKKITFAFDGQIAWQISPLTGGEDPQEVTGEQAEMVKENADMFDEPFIDYKKKGFKIELVGKEDMEGTEVYKLKLTKKSNQEIFYFIDSEAYIELKTQMIRKTADGQEMNIETYFGEFKEVNGVMYPHSMKIKANGADRGNIVLESIETNVQLDENFFKMPPKKTAAPAKEPVKQEK